jgi:hypothetical protein
MLWLRFKPSTFPNTIPDLYRCTNLLVEFKLVMTAVLSSILKAEAASRSET